MNLFSGRNKDREKWGERLPSGQKLTEGWPVLHYGSIPQDRHGRLEARASAAWWRSRCRSRGSEFQALPKTTALNDIHCVTTWSKFDNNWKGVAVSEVMQARHS